MALNLELERRLADLLFVDVGLAAARDTRDPVAPPAPSKEGKRKKSQQLTADGESPLHSLRTLLDAMGSQARVTLRVSDGVSFDQVATPTKWQASVIASAKRPPA